MSSHRVRARAPRGEPRAPASVAADEAGAYLRDAANTPGGHTSRVVFPTSEAEVAWALRQAPAVLPVGAQSSLTGGATPFGAWVLSLSRMDAMAPVARGRVRVGAGVALLSLEEALRPSRLFFPPVPTFRGAFAGGVVSTNAAGAATFKYGPTRPWVHALTAVLAGGEVLDLERGRCRAHPGGFFEIELAREMVQVPIPTYPMPDVPKRSAGYHAEPGMDLVDLFVGSEGTLGVITEVELRLQPEPGARVLALATFGDEAEALAAVGRLRQESRATWDTGDARGLDIAAVESMDARCLELLREDGQDRAQGVALPAAARTALLIEAEARGEVDDLLEALGRVLRQSGARAEDDVLVALPGDSRRAAQLRALREAVPMAVNHRIAAAQRAGQPRVQKTAGDMIVPFAQLPDMMARYREAFASRGLDHAIWGHVSDGNVHANVIPRTDDDVHRGEEALAELGQEVIRRGGCPLSEHGVGRNPVKQALLRLLYGDHGIEEMRRVKAALDPEWRLSPGVLFPR
ncbi:MAG TPA: FAD-binding oxidoreductase [Vicinamibacteria bacterium]